MWLIRSKWVRLPGLVNPHAQGRLEPNVSFSPQPTVTSLVATYEVGRPPTIIYLLLYSPQRTSIYLESSLLDPYQHFSLTWFLPSPRLYVFLSSCFLVPTSHFFCPSHPIVFLLLIHWTTGFFPGLPDVPFRKPLACITHNTIPVLVFMVMRIPWRMRHATSPLFSVLSPYCLLRFCSSHCLF